MLVLAPNDTLGAKQDAGTDILFNLGGSLVTDSTGLGVAKTAHGALSTTAAALITTPASGTSLAIFDMKLTNTGTSTRVVTLYVDRNDASPEFDATTQWGSTITLGPGESADWTGHWVTYDQYGQPRLAIATTVLDVVRKLTADVVNATAAFADITGLSVAIEANKSYVFEAWLFHKANAATNGSRFSITGPTTPTHMRAGIWSTEKPGGLVVTDVSIAAITAYDAELPGVQVNASTTTVLSIISGGVDNGVNAGNLVLRSKAETAVAAALTVERGSWFRVREVG